MAYLIGWTRLCSNSLRQNTAKTPTRDQNPRRRSTTSCSSMDHNRDGHSLIQPSDWYDSFVILLTTRSYWPSVTFHVHITFCMDFAYGVAHRRNCYTHHSWPCNDSFSFYTFTATIVEHSPCTLLICGAWWTNLEQSCLSGTEKADRVADIFSGQVGLNWCFHERHGQEFNIATSWVSSDCNSNSRVLDPPLLGCASGTEGLFSLDGLLYASV